MHKTIAIWDWDYTLADTKAAVKAALQDMAAHYGLPPLTDAEVDNVMGSHRGTFWQRNFGAPDSPEMEAALRFYVGRYRTHCDMVRLFPEAKETLQLLNDWGVNQILLSNKNEPSLVEEAKSTGVFDLFRFVKGTTSALGKPEVDFVLPLLNQLEFDTILYIGDGQSDLDMAHNLGAPFILMHHNRDILPHEYFCANFAELQTLLTNLKNTVLSNERA